MAVADGGERVHARGGGIEHDPATGWHERLPVGAVVEVAERHRLTERVVQGRAVVVVVVEVVVPVALAVVVVVVMVPPVPVGHDWTIFVIGRFTGSGNEPGRVPGGTFSKV